MRYERYQNETFEGNRRKMKTTEKEPTNSNRRKKFNSNGIKLKTMELWREC
jgi:hypothetical protein